MAKIPTVKIKAGDDYAIINKSDFDPKKHTKYGEKRGRKPKKSGDK